MDQNLLRDFFSLGARLETSWISVEGALRIMRDAGIVRGRIAHEVANRTREEYLRNVLFEVAHAVALQSANPAAFVTGEDEGWAPAELKLLRWARKNAHQLEELLAGFDATAEPASR